MFKNIIQTKTMRSVVTDLYLLHSIMCLERNVCHQNVILICMLHVYIFWRMKLL